MAELMLEAKEIRRVLVIAPLRVAKSVWKQETAKWEHLSHLKLSVVTGTDKKRRKALNAKAHIYVINRENIVWLVTACKGKWPFDAVIVDESSSFKSPSSKRFRALKAVCHLPRIMILLTGTPSPNGLMDLWSQMYLIDQGQTLGKTVTGYRQRFFVPNYLGYGWNPKLDIDATIHKLIEPIVISMRAEDYIEVPPRIDLMEVIELPNQIMNKYEQFEKQLFLECDNGDTLEAMSTAILANKLLQFANGAIYIDEKIWRELHTAKLEALKELVEENQGENILIAYNYRHDLDRIKLLLPEAIVLGKDPRTIDRWNQGVVPIMLAHPGACGHGLNLQDGGSVLIWFGLTWNLEHYQQMIARLYRQGQTQPVRVVHIVAKETIDDRVLSVLIRKNAVQEDLLKALRR
jgi:SNF2 family DNA or RNA helicase